MENKSKSKNVVYVLIFLIIATALAFTAITLAWFTDSESFPGSVAFGVVKIDTTSGENTQSALTKTITRNIGTLGEKVMPGDTVNFTLRINLTSNSEPAYYLVKVAGTGALSSLTSEGFYYLNNTLQLATDNSKSAGEITSAAAVTMNIPFVISTNFTQQNASGNVTCTVAVVQQANVGYSNEYSSLTAEQKVAAQKSAAYDILALTLDPTRERFMHISFDDVEICFNNLKTKNYSSLYEEPFFNWLRTLHNTYNAKFSLYSYNNVLTNVPNTFAAEFTAASDWLKIGLHATNSSSKFDNSTYDQGKAEWNTFVTNITRITGTQSSIDRMPRLHYFAGTENALKGMRDANCGALGFITSDGIRDSYYLDSTITNFLYNNDHITDTVNNLVFVATDIRLDWLQSDNSDYVHRQFSQNSVYNELDSRYSNSQLQNTLNSFIVFGHEWLYYNGTTITENGRNYFEDACRFAYDNHINIDFPQNRTFNATESDIEDNSSTEQGGNEVGEGDETETVNFVAIPQGLVNTFRVVHLITDMVFQENCMISGDATGNGLITDGSVASRAAGVTVLEVNGGETLSLIENLSSLGLSEMRFAIQEFCDVPLSRDTLSANRVVVGDADRVDISKCLKWIETGSITLLSNTRYVMIAFKKTDNTTMTSAEAALLSQCLTIS